MLLPLFTPPKEERGRITVTRTSSLIVVEGRTLPRGREAPLLVRSEARTLSEEEDSLSEAPRRVSFDEEPPIEMTSRSMMGCSIELLESLPLPPIPMAESNKREDILKDGSTLSKEARRQWIVTRNQASTPFKGEANSSITGRSWSGALKFLTVTLPLSRTNRDSITCPLREWHVCKSSVCVPHTLAVTPWYIFIYY